jgi:hypothetical protein
MKTSVNDRDRRGHNDQLAGMARNKVAAQARKHAADKRDFRRGEGLDGAEELHAGDASPSQEVAGAELLAEFRARLSAEERRIAAELGGAADSRRFQYRRALNRVARNLGLEEDEDE